MNRKLKQSVREHIESFSLNEAQLEQLESLGAQANADKAGHFTVYHWSLAAAAAVFLLAFILTSLIPEQKNIYERIAQEVALNHIKLKPLEIETSNIDGVRDYFSKLDFVPVSSTLVSESGLELIGGRYCSLQGIGAAQLRFKQPEADTVQTLYQTEYRKDIFEDMPVLDQGDEPVELYAKGIRVVIWVEKDLLFALTESP